MCPVEHGYLAQVGARFPQFLNALHHESRLIVGILQRHKRRFHARGMARGLQMFFKLPYIRGNGGICHLQHLGYASVVRLDLVHRRAGVAFGELQDILEIRAAP